MSFLRLIGPWTIKYAKKPWGVTELTSFCDEVLMVHLTHNYGSKFGGTLPAVAVSIINKKNNKSYGRIPYQVGGPLKKRRAMSMSTEVTEDPRLLEESKEREPRN